MVGEASRAAEEIARQVSRAALARGLTVGTAESLTAGVIATHLGGAGDASEWFRGAVVAYAKGVKFELLGVRPGPVITAECARQMADGARRVLGTDVAVAVTGAGGPGPEEGQPAGTVYLAVAGPAGTEVEHRQFPGDPDRVVQQTVEAALTLLLRGLAS